METTVEERVRQRAYQLWEQEGRPNGRDEEHWHRARQEIEAEHRPHGSAPGGGASGVSTSLQPGGTAPGGGPGTGLGSLGSGGGSTADMPSGTARHGRG